MWKEKKSYIVLLTLGYGLTELSPNTHMTPKEHAYRMRGTVGPLEANLEARLVVSEREDGEALEDAPEGGPGEIWIRGPIVMKVSGDYRKNWKEPG
jgi:4-coumarate--CoA ligase